MRSSLDSKIVGDSDANAVIEELQQECEVLREENRVLEERWIGLDKVNKEVTKKCAKLEEECGNW